MEEVTTTSNPWSDGLPMSCNNSSSDENVLEFDHVSKRYESSASWVYSGFRHFLRKRKKTASSIGTQDESCPWAVRDLSFTIKRGEAVGIIGENGAGKSTILKLMAGIITPTTGRVLSQGRLVSLIELGAGFNPELSGRDNIYLNGAVLGLSRKEIAEEFDRIVDFSGVGASLDKPVKYYSSGMYARLGFAIASHAKADIVLTDEILTVGDIAFQRQCMQKFEEIKAQSSFVLVSHDHQLVRRICSRAIWIREGIMQLDGSCDKVVDAYLEYVRQRRDDELKGQQPLGPTIGASRWGSGEIEIETVTTHDGNGNDRRVFRTGDGLIIRLRYYVKVPNHDPGFCVQIRTKDDCWVHGTNTFDDGIPIRVQLGRGVIELRYPSLSLLAGTYWLYAGVTSQNDWNAPYDLRVNVQRFDVVTAFPDGGMVRLEHCWNHGEAGVGRQDLPISLAAPHKRTFS